MPHQVPFSLANLSILDCAVARAPNNWHASFGDALRSFAALIAAAFFSASSRSLKNSCTQGGICWGDGGCACACACALAAVATSGTMQRLNIARRNLMKPTPPGNCHYTALEGANNNPNASGRRQLGMFGEGPREGFPQGVNGCRLRLLQFDPCRVTIFVP